MRRTLSSHLRTALVILVSALALGSCGGTSSQPSPGPHGSGVLHVGLVGSFQLEQLDPAREREDKNSSLIRSLIFPPLVTVDRQLNVKPWAADGWTTSTDGLTYTFKIKPGLRWSDGTSIDATTYAYSLNRSLDPCTIDPSASFLYAIKGAQAFNTSICDAPPGAANPVDSQTLVGKSIVASDPQTLVITLEAPAAYFVPALGTLTQAFAQPQQLIYKYGTPRWTGYLTGYGAGMCQLANPPTSTHAQVVATPTTTDDQNESSGDDIDANGDVDGPSDTDDSPPPATSPSTPISGIALTCSQVVPALPSWDTHCCDDGFPFHMIDFTFYSDPDTEYNTFRSGALDVGFIPSSQYLDARNQPYFHQIPSLAIDYVEPNLLAPPFDDLRARQAFALALNKDQIANAVFQGAVIATNHIVPQGQYGYDANLTGVKGASTAGDPHQATTLIMAYAADKCGGDVTKCPPVTFETDNGAAALKESQAFLQMWRAAMPGYPITLHNVDINTVLTDLSGASTGKQVLQLFGLGYGADYPDPQDWLGLQFGPGSIPYLAGADKLTTLQTDMQKCNTEQASARIADCNAAEQEAVNQVAWIPIDQEKDLWGVQSKVHNYADTPLGYPSLDELYKTYLSS